MPKLTTTQKDQIAAILALACGGPQHIEQSEDGDWTVFTDNQAMWSYSTWWGLNADGHIVQVMECEPSVHPSNYVNGLTVKNAEGDEDSFIVYATIDAISENLLAA